MGATRGASRRGRVGLLVAGGLIGTLLVALPIQAKPAAQDVKVVNATSEPVPVAVQGTVATTRADSPALERVQQTVLVLFTAGETEKNDVVYTVPAGKRLVVERASFQGQVEAGETAAVFVNSSGPSGSLAVTTHDLGLFAGRGQMLIGNEEGPVYADGGAAVRVRVILSKAAVAGGRFEVSFSGHLVDAP